MKLALLSLLALGCATNVYVSAPPPPCFDAPTKREIGALCTGEWGAAGACESFGSWMQDYIKWRKGVYGEKLCRIEDPE